MTILRRNNVTVSGSGRDVLMFGHGYGGDQTMWHGVAPSFEWDYKVVLFDYVGAGGSDATAFDADRYCTLRGYALDVLDICRELDLKRVTFVGHSVSAMIGALAAIMEPQHFSNLVMIDPSPCYLNEPDYKGGFSRSEIDGLLNVLENDFKAWSTQMAPVIAGNPDKPYVAEEFAACLDRTDPAIAKHFARITFLSDYRGDLPKLMTRTLILQSEEDVMVGVNIGHYMQQAVANSKFVLLDATGHLPHLSAPELVVQSIKDFLSYERN
jgi:sigma-B regulation protein RsbQ